jgi:predicted NUDIX family NTP pyrophosphohydrolase
MFEMQWPPGSGRMAGFPEADRASWFTLAEARRKILKGQAPILDALIEHIAGKGS